MHSEKGFAESFNFLLFTRENFSPIKEMKWNTSFAAVKLAGSIIGQNIPPPPHTQKRKHGKETSEVDQSFVNWQPYDHYIYQRLCSGTSNCLYNLLRVTKNII